MRKFLLSLMGVLALCAESTGQQPAPPVAAAPDATCPATAACTEGACFGEPYQLAPARINAEGKVVFRRQLNPASPIPCGALKTEEPQAADPLKPRVVVLCETVSPADVAWFDRNGKPVDAEVVGKQLATWRPVLVLPRAKESYFQGEPEQTLLESFRPDLLIAVVSTQTHASAGREYSTANRPVPASPIPTRARIDEKGLVIFRPTLAKAVHETRSKEIRESTEAGQKTRTESYKIMVPLVMVSQDESVVEPKNVQFFDTEGKPVEASIAAQRLAKEATVLVSADREKVNAFYLKAAQPDALACVLPFDIFTGHRVEPVKACEPAPCEAPLPVPEAAAPLPASPSSP